jgi:hypothetical protein
MGMPQGTTTDTRADEQRGTVPANENVLKVVAVPGVEDSFALVKREFAKLKNAPLVNVPSSMESLEHAINDFEKDMRDTAIEAVMRMPDAKVEITGDAPAIIVRRSISEAINRGDLRPGQKLPGKDIILVTAWEPINRAGARLGKKLASFGAPENLSGTPRTFNQNVIAISNLHNWHGHDGWNFDRQRDGTSSYEDGRFKGYQDGTAIGTWGVPELPILNGNDRGGNPVAPAENMLVLSRDGKSAFKDFVTSGSVDAEWSQACTENRVNPDNVRSVRFPDGKVGWDGKDYHRSCVRPVVALELNHLIL